MAAGLVSTATSTFNMEVVIATGATTVTLDGLQMATGMGAQRIILGQITVDGIATLEFTMEFTDEAFQEFDAFGHPKTRSPESIGGRF